MTPVNQSNPSHADPMDDPRRFPDPSAAPPALARLYDLAARSLGAATAQDADACDRQVAQALDAMLGAQAPSGSPPASLSALFDAAPSSAVYRYLWRIASRRERAGAFGASRVVRVFALPVVVVTGVERPDAAGTVLPCVVPDAAALAAILREGGALAGNENVALSDTLVGAGALAFDRLGALLALEPAQSLPPAPIVVTAPSEGVHLRFVVGTVLAAAGADIFRERGAGAWAMPLAKALSGALAAPRVSVLALPRPPLPLVEAAWQGRLAQREIGAQLFASNALRKMRAATGEPTAVLSVHASDIDPRSAEVRLSLSSPFDPAQAEGLRCEVAPLESVDDVASMLEALLSDCRVSDVRRMPGVHADRDPATGRPLLFKGDAAPAALH